MSNQDLDKRPENPETELKKLRRKVKQLEMDNRMLVVMNQNAEQLRRSYEVEKNLQYLYNDLLLKNCPNMIFLFNEQLRFVICSSACLPLVSSDNRADLVNLPFEEVFSAVLEREWVGKVCRQNQEVLQSLDTCTYDDMLMILGDKELHVQVSISPIVDDEQCCRGTIMTINDITEIVLAKQQIEEALASKSNFLANMSHEIRTPMNAIKGLSELLALTELNRIQRNYVRNVIGAANTLLGIINDVLDFSKIDARKIEFVEGDYKLASLITGVCNVVNVRAAEKDLTLTIDVDPALPVSLWGDEIRIKQIITNILSNAVKYTNEGYVRIYMRMERDDDQTWLVCEVEDSGIGISEDEISGVFDSFSRADLHKNRNITGTGLGLAISKQLCIAMGGDIWVNSVYGKGSTFGFRIPQKIVDETPIAFVSDKNDKKVLLLGDSKSMQEVRRQLASVGVSAYGITEGQDLVWPDGVTHCIADKSVSIELIKELKQRIGGARFAEIRDLQTAMTLSEYFDTVLYLPLFITDLAAFLNNKKEMEPVTDDEAGISGLKVNDTLALVVDDNEINVIVCSEMLYGFEAAVQSAENGEQAIRMCKETKYDIIFMDHMMPGMDGVETTQLIRDGDGPNKNTPIVALTANVINDMKSYYLKNRMDDFIGKPMEMSDLSRVLVKWLPEEKLNVRKGSDAGSERLKKTEAGQEVMTSAELIAALDNFGMYASDVMRELGGDFNIYIRRMELASRNLGRLTNELKEQAGNLQWTEFAQNMLELGAHLQDIGARDCAARARKLAQAAKDGNITYVHEDFTSLMANMYMMERKVQVITSFGHNETEITGLNSPEFLYGCLKKMGKALDEDNVAGAMEQLDHAASFSLDKRLDSVLQAIRVKLVTGDIDLAKILQREITREFLHTVSS